MKYNVAFNTEKREDGEVYIVLDTDKSKYEYELGKTTFEAESVKFGILEISKYLLSLLKNSKLKDFLTNNIDSSLISN